MPSSDTALGPVQFDSAVQSHKNGSIFGCDTIAFYAWLDESAGETLRQRVVDRLLAQSARAGRVADIMARACDDELLPLDTDMDAVEMANFVWARADEFDGLRQRARDELEGSDEAGTPILDVIDWGGRAWQLLSWSPRRAFQASLRHEDATIHIRIRAGKSADVLVELRSIMLWSGDWCTQIESFIAEVFGRHLVRTQIKRADMAFDVSGDHLGYFASDHFVCRARKCRLFNLETLRVDVLGALNTGRDSALQVIREVDGEWRTFMGELQDALSVEDEQACRTAMESAFHGRLLTLQSDALSMVTHGQRGTDSPYLRVYRKDLELSRHPLEKRAFFEDLYARNNVDIDDGVTRIEFELGRGFFREFTFVSDGSRLGIDTVTGFLQYWRYVMSYLLGSKDERGWCSLHYQAERKSDRVDIHPLWESLRSGMVVLAAAQRSIHRIVRRDRMMVQLVRSALSYLAVSLREDWVAMHPAEAQMIVDNAPCAADYLCTQFTQAVDMGLFENLLHEDFKNYQDDLQRSTVRLRTRGGQQPFENAMASYVACKMAFYHSPSLERV